MKQQTRVLFGTLIGIIILVGIGQLVLNNQNNVSAPSKSAARTLNNGNDGGSVAKGTRIVVDFGDGKQTEEYIVAANAFEALQKVANERNWNIQTKQYKYGSVVESIGQTENTGSSQWSFFINGKKGVIPPERAQIAASDFVEWRYEKQ